MDEMIIFTNKGGNKIIMKVTRERNPYLKRIFS